MVPHRPEDYREIWAQKPVLQVIYAAWYEQILENCLEGRTLEIGGGSGNLKMFSPNVVATDILFAPWLDSVCDAQRLPFADNSFQNLVLFDVLHHLERPVLFFEEASRVLAPGGRVIMMEPGITPLSHLFYHFFHEEPVDMSADPYQSGGLSTDKDPYDANQAIPTLLFGSQKRRTYFQETFPAFKILESSRCAHVVYPLSGGFQPWSLVPLFAVKFLLGLEKIISPVLRLLISFRIFVVLEKTS